MSFDRCYALRVCPPQLERLPLLVRPHTMRECGELQEELFYVRLHSSSNFPENTFCPPSDV